MRQVTEKEIKIRLALDNPWWESGWIDDEFQKMPRRGYFDLFQRLVDEREVRRAVVLMGPRRVGKTVMIYHAIQDLIDRGVPASSFFYVSLDTPLYNSMTLEQLLNLYLASHPLEDEGHAYVFFDEIQYHKDWEVHLKSLVDTYRSVRFVASGSAAAALKLKSTESGAGRFTDFMLPPLTFAEYLRFVELEDDLVVPEEGGLYTTTDIETLNVEFIKYLNFGGYPEAVFSPAIQADSARYIRSDIIDKVMLRDLPSLYGIQDIQELNSLFTTVAYNTGNEVSLEGLAQSSGVAKNTIRRYLEYLEAAFLILRVRRVDERGGRFKRQTHFKVYLTNACMRAALFGPVSADHEAMGSLAETAAFSQWSHSTLDELHYARWKDGEVDIVCLSRTSQTPEWVAEIKWSDRYVDRLGELTSILKFAELNCLDGIAVTTRTVAGTVEYKGKEIRFDPCSVYCYAVGRNLLEGRLRTKVGT